MDGEAVKKIADLAQENHVVDRHGVLYGARAYTPIYDDPRPGELVLHTLDGLLEYVKENPDMVSVDEMYVVVSDPAELFLLSDVHGPSNQRHVIVRVVWQAITGFEFGRFYDPEAFNIELRAKFRDTPDRQRILDYVARIDVDNGASLEDDGVSQKMTVKRAVSGHLVDREAAPSTVTLAPFRTFDEIEQPESLFLLRLSSKDSGVSCGLFEADGGAWKHAGTRAIAAYLRERFGESIAVIA